MTDSYFQNREVSSENFEYESYLKWLISGHYIMVLRKVENASGDIAEFSSWKGSKPQGIEE